MTLDEMVQESGALLRYTLVSEGRTFALRAGDEPIGVFSAQILRDVVKRYARPLEQSEEPGGERLELGPTLSLVAWHYKAPVDLENKLYLVLLEEGQAPLAVLSRQIVNALVFLSRDNH